MTDTIQTTIQIDKWQRLSPIAIVYYIVKFVVGLVKQGVQGLAPFAAILFAAGENRWFVISIIAIAAGVLLVAAAILSYLKFRYRLTQDTILIQSGVLTRKRLSLSFDRIQNVAVREPIYFRRFNTVVLALESAGSSQAEVSLAGISRSLAEEIRTLVLETKTKAASEASEPREASAGMVEDEQEIIRLPISELARYGLSNNNIWVFAGILAGAFAQFDWWEYVIFKDLGDYVGDYNLPEAWMVAVSAFIGAASLIAVLMAVSAIGSIIVYYDYKLSRYADGRLHRTKGLFEKQETSLPESKLQSLTINQSWPALLLRRFNLTLNQVGFGSAPGNGVPNTAPKFIVPSVQEPFLASFSKLLYPEFEWQALPLNGISIRYSFKLAFYVFLPIATIPAITLTILFGAIGLLPLLTPLVVFPLIELRRKKYGYAKDRLHGIVQSGFIGTSRTIIPFRKVQTVSIVRSPGQRRHGLATLKIKMAGTRLTIPYMLLEDAEQWRRDILFQVESDTRSWM